MSRALMAGLAEKWRPNFEQRGLRGAMRIVAIGTVLRDRLMFPQEWTAKLRAMKTDQHLLLLKTNLGSGHFGASGRYEHLKETAFNYAFVLTALGVQ